MLVEKKDLSEFVLEIKKTLNQAGRILTKEALETMNSLVKIDSRRKQNWYVHEKSALNSLATLFGEVNYQRTYYKHKTEKEYRYLSDEMVGIKPYDKMDVSLKAKLIEEATETPYARRVEKAAEELEFSSQSVMNAIRELGPVQSGEVKITRAKEPLASFSLKQTKIMWPFKRKAAQNHSWCIPTKAGKKWGKMDGS